MSAHSFRVLHIYVLPYLFYLTVRCLAKNYVQKEGIKIKSKGYSTVIPRRKNLRGTLPHAAARLFFSDTNRLSARMIPCANASMIAKILDICSYPSPVFSPCRR